MAEIQISFQDGDASGKPIKIVAFNGQLDETNVDEEAKKIYEVIEQMTEPNLVLDFNDLAYMNSKSIGYVTDWYSKVSAKKGKVVIARPRPNILDILKVVGITQIISIHASVEEAKLAFAGGESTPSDEPTMAAPTPAEPTEPETTEAPAVPVAAPAPMPEQVPAELTPAAPEMPAPEAPAPMETPAPAPEVSPAPEMPTPTPEPQEPAMPEASPEEEKPMEEPQMPAAPEANPGEEPTPPAPPAA